MAAVLTWISEAIASGGYAGSYTFTAQAIGTASADRQVILASGTREGSDFSSITIAGVTSTLVVDTSAADVHSAINIANVTTGTTGDIVLNATAGINFVGIQVFTGTGINATATGTALDNFSFDDAPRTLSWEILSGGFGIWTMFIASGVDASPAWSNLADNQNEASSGTDSQIIAASSASAGTASRGVTDFAFAGAAYCAASFEAAAAGSAIGRGLTRSILLERPRLAA